MPDKITTLKLIDNTDVFPNIKDENIPDTIMRIADLSKYLNKLKSINITGDVHSTTNSSDIATFTTANISTLNVSGVSRFKGASTFDSDVEVDGRLTLNSPSDIHFKTGDSDYTDFNKFKKLYYAEAGIGKYAGAVFPQYEMNYSFDDLVNYTNISFMFNNCTFAGGGIFDIPDFSNDIITGEHVFTYLKGRNIENTEDQPFKLALGNLNLSSGYFTFYGMKNCTDILIRKDRKVAINSHANYTFANSQELESIGAIDMTSVTEIINIFLDCRSLKHIHCTHWRASFDIAAFTAFEQSDLVEIISNLDPVSTAKTLKMGSTNLAKLTQEQILVATGKGWTLA